MKDLFYVELRDVIREIREDEKFANGIYTINTEAKILIYTLDMIKALCTIVRGHGFLELDEHIIHMDKTPESRLLVDIFLSVVDGFDGEYIEEYGMGLYCSSVGSVYKKLSELMMIEGALLIWDGQNPIAIAWQLKSIIPEEILEKEEFLREEYQKNGCKGMPAIPEIKEQEVNLVEILCKAESPVTPKDDYYDFIRLSDYIFQTCNDTAMQRLLRDVDNKDLAAALMVLEGKTRKRFFDNLSVRLGVMVAIDMDYSSPVSFDEAIKALRQIVSIFMKLADGGVIVYPEQDIVRQMRNIFLNIKAASEGDIDAFKILKESENELYELWKDYVKRSNKLLYFPKDKK